MPDTIVIPNVVPIIRHGLPTVLECNIVPAALFVILLGGWGAAAAIIGAMSWTALALLRRKLRGGATPGLLVLGTIAVTTRSVLAVATGSLLVYFLQPTVGTGLVALAFLVSVPLGRPLAERLALDICPFDEATKNHPVLRSFLGGVSLLWAGASLVNFGITLWLLLTQSATTFVVVKALLGPAVTVVFSAIAIVWFRRTMSRAGVRVIWRGA